MVCCVSILQNSGDERIWRESSLGEFPVVFLVQLDVSLVFPEQIDNLIYFQ